MKKFTILALILSAGLFSILTFSSCDDECSVGDLDFRGSCGDNGGQEIYSCEYTDEEDGWGGNGYEYEYTGACSRCSTGESFNAECEEDSSKKQRVVCVKGGEWVAEGGCF